MDSVADASASQEGWQPPLFAASTWVLIISAVVLIFVYDYWCHHVLARAGMPQTKPIPFVGDVLGMFINKEGIRGDQEETCAKYGKIVGSYMGWRPQVLVADPDLVRQMCIKDFSSFPNRKDFGVKNEPFDKALTVLRDDHWKDVRGILSPTFSGSKMKQMVPLINSCLDPTVRKVAKFNSEGKTIDFKEIYGGFLIDSIGTCAFGLTLNSQETEDDPFLYHAKDIFKLRMSIAAMVFLFAPFLMPVVNYFKLTTFDRKTLKFFEDVIDQAVELRKSGAERRVDFLQLMLDVEHRTEEDKAEATEEERLEEEHRKKSSKKSLTTGEVKSQGLLFFLAGFDTSGTTLGFASHLLALHPEVQDKLVAEVDTIAPGRDDVTYENITKMTYLDCVICETLRVYPPAVFTSRECEADYKYQGFTIPKGTSVNFAVWLIHRDPELWEEPEKFDPDRFTPEKRENRHPCAWMPFGVGPRNCVAMRFALLQVKMGLVRMLQNFRFEKCAETEDPIKLPKFSMNPDNGFKLAAIPRS